MKENRTKPDERQAASIAARERAERKGARVCDPQQLAAQSNGLRLTEPRSAEASLRSLCSFAAIFFLLLSSPRASATVRYVDVNSASPTPPYTNWATAARVIQDAVDAARAGDTVLVRNGVYAAGQWNGNRVSITNAIRLESVNGPLVTRIEGNGNAWPWIRCVYLGDNAVLSGFTLTNGFSRFGGGVLSEPSGILNNCVLEGNSGVPIGPGPPGRGGGAWGGTLYNCTIQNCTVGGNDVGDGVGGGAYDCALHNCILRGNAASASYGGGAFVCTLYNCTVTGNSSGGGSCIFYNCLVIDNENGSSGEFYNCTVVSNNGGVWGTVFNSIVYGNINGNYDEATILSYCLTTPLPTNGVGNITADPLFVDTVSGDFRLRHGSPCIDTGTNLFDLITTDITGLPRPMDGNYDGVAKFDMGAYEFNPYRFEPMLSLTADGFRFSIRGEPGKSVRIERSRDLMNWEFAGQIPIPASGQTLIDPAATTETQLFYRAMRTQ